MLCPQCFEAVQGNNIPDILTYLDWSFPFVQIDKWPYFELECANEHKYKYTLSNELYDLLFQQATYCIQDGYFRESIGTYHAAMERYFEYCIEIFTYYHNPDTDFKKLWKIISKQSERQLGAFYSLWLATLGENPVFLEEKRVELRNKVIHQGKLVNENEAKDYGKYVFDYIRNSNSKLDSKLGERLAECHNKRRYRICKDDIKKLTDISAKGIGSVNIPSYLSDVTEYPDYLSCFQKTQINGIGFVK